MAQSVGYFEDFKTEERRQEAYSEGPFVIVFANGWRIEVDNGGKCPSLPDPTIYRLRESLGYTIGKYTEEEAIKQCDHLNRLVKEKVIIKDDNGLWHVPKFMERKY